MKEKDELGTELETKLGNGLTRWIAKHEIKPAEFAKKMGYSYVHAWSLLTERTPFTQEAFGRFTVAYGTDAAAELMGLAKLPNGLESVEILSKRKDVLPILVVNRKNGK